MGLFDFKRKSHKDVRKEIADEEGNLLKLVSDDLIRAQDIVAHLEKVKRWINVLRGEPVDEEKSKALQELNTLKEELKKIDVQEKSENVQQELIFLSCIEELLIKNK